MKNFKNYINENNFNHNEPLSAKIRNQLGPYWNLIPMIKSYDKTSNEKIWKIIMENIEVIEKNKSKILEFINKIEKE